MHANNGGNQESASNTFPNYGYYGRSHPTSSVISTAASAMSSGTSSMNPGSSASQQRYPGSYSSQHSCSLPSDSGTQCTQDLVCWYQLAQNIQTMETTLREFNVLKSDIAEIKQSLINGGNGKTSERNVSRLRSDETDDYLIKVARKDLRRTEIPVPLPLDSKEDVDRLEEIFSSEEETQMSSEMQGKYVRKSII